MTLGRWRTTWVIGICNRRRGTRRWRRTGSRGSGAIEQINRASSEAAVELSLMESLRRIALVGVVAAVGSGKRHCRYKTNASTASTDHGAGHA
jgi:hypothetical protein